MPRLLPLQSSAPDAGRNVQVDSVPVVARQLSSLKVDDPSLRGTVERLSAAVSTAIAIHS
jgi:hypothetical protein